MDKKAMSCFEQIPWSERNRNLLHRKTDDPANKPTTEKSIAMQGGIPRPKAKAWNRGERAPVTQASACASRLIHALSRHCSRRLFRRMLARTVSFYDRFGAKRRPGFRRKEWSQYRERLRSERNANNHGYCCCTSHGGPSYQNPIA
jgi:hypothetical protein